MRVNWSHALSFSQLYLIALFITNQSMVKWQAFIYLNTFMQDVEGVNRGIFCSWLPCVSFMIALNARASRRTTNSIRSTCNNLVIVVCQFFPTKPFQIFIWARLGSTTLWQSYRIPNCVGSESGQSEKSHVSESCYYGFFWLQCTFSRSGPPNPHRTKGQQRFGCKIPSPWQWVEQVILRISDDILKTSSAYTRKPTTICIEVITQVLSSIFFFHS